MAATNLERSDFSKHGKLGEICATSREKSNKQQNIFVHRSKYLCKSAVDWVTVIITISESVTGVTCLLAFIWNDP